MRIDLRTNGSSIVVFNLIGRLTAGLAITLLHNQVDDLLRNNFKEIVVDMEQVDLVDCAGIGQMSTCWCKVRKQCGSPKLVHVYPRLRLRAQMLWSSRSERRKRRLVLPKNAHIQRKQANCVASGDNVQDRNERRLGSTDTNT